MSARDDYLTAISQLIEAIDTSVPGREFAHTLPLIENLRVCAKKLGQAEPICVGQIPDAYLPRLSRKIVGRPPPDRRKPGIAPIESSFGKKSVKKPQEQSYWAVGGPLERSNTLRVIAAMVTPPVGPSRCIPL